MTRTFDFAQLLTIIAIILMMCGVLHFTPVVVGALLLASMCGVKVTW